MQSNVDYKALVEAVGDAIMACNADGKVILWNAACERIFGHTQQEALGQSLDMIIPARQQHRHWEGYAQTMASGKTKYGTKVLRVPAMHKDGHTLSIAFSVAMLFGPDQTVDSIVAVVRDESAKFAEDRELRKRLAELEAQVAAAGKAA